MAKTGRAPERRVVIPMPPITRARQPIAVRFRLNWDPPFANADDDIETGWALAWTSACHDRVSERNLGPAGLVVWVADDGDVSTAWLPADHIRRGWIAD